MTFLDALRRTATPPEVLGEGPAAPSGVNELTPPARSAPPSCGARDLFMGAVCTLPADRHPIHRDQTDPAFEMTWTTTPSKETR